MGVGAGFYMYDVVVKKFTFAISSPDKFLLSYLQEYIAHCLSHYSIYALLGGTSLC